MMGAAIKMLDQTEAYGRTNATNFLTLMNSLETILVSDYDDAITAVAQGLRTNLAGMIEPSVAAAFLRPFIRQFCQTIIGRTNLASDQEMLSEWYKYAVDNNQRVTSMNYTFGTPTAGTNVGNGQILRLTTDSYGFPIEGAHIDSKRALCIADYQTGTNRGEEIFQLTGQSSARDDLQRSGSGQQTILTARSADNSILLNPTWTQFSGTAAAPTDITNWTSLTAAGAALTVDSTTYSFDSTNYFRAAPSDGSTSYALNIKATAVLSQKLSVRGSKLRTDRPYVLAVVWNRAVNSANGTLLLRLGTGASTSVSVAAQTGWNVTTVPNAMGIGNWYRIFGSDDMSIQISWTQSSGSGILIDDVLLLEGTPFEVNNVAHYYWAIPNSAATYIPHRILDSFTWADQSPQTGKNQKWLTRAFPGFYHPHAIGSGISWSDS